MLLIRYAHIGPVIRPRTVIWHESEIMMSLYFVKDRFVHIRQVGVVLQGQFILYYGSMIICYRLDFSFVYVNGSVFKSCSAIYLIYQYVCCLVVFMNKMIYYISYHTEVRR